MKRTIFLLLLIFNFIYSNLSADLNYSDNDFVTSKNILLMIEPTSGEILNASSGAHKFYQYSQLIGMTIDDINTLSVGEIRNEMSSAKYEKRNYFHFKHLLHNGDVRDVYVTSYPMENNNKKVLLSTIRDVTEEIKTAKTLNTLKNIVMLVLLLAIFTTIYLLLKVNKKSRKYKELFENMIEAFALHDMIYDEDGKALDYRFVDINPNFEKVTGLKRETTIGKTVKELLPNTEQYWIDSYGEVAKTGKPMFFKNYSVEMDKHFECQAFSPRKDSFAVVFSDVTEREHAVEKLKKYQKEQLSLTNHIIISLSGLLEQHDVYTKDHSENVAELSEKLAEKLNLSRESIVKTYYAGLVHDIGKTIIPGDILRKKERLSEDEFNCIKEHPVIGYKSLRKSSELVDIAKIVLHHHERWDGRGYPNKLIGEETPIEARILAVVDAYDAMTSDRPYRSAQAKEYAINELKNNAGSQFDLKVVKAFLKII